MVKRPRLSASFASIISQLKPRRVFGSKRRRNRRMLYSMGGAGAAAIVLLLLLLSPKKHAPALEQGAISPALAAQTAQPFIGTQTVPAPGATVGVTPGLAPGATPELSPDDILDADAPLPTPSPTPEPPAPTPTIAPTATPQPTRTPTPVDMDKLVQYYMVEAKSYYNDMGFSSNYYEYTDDDVYMLAQVIYGEARGESTKGKIAVANVVMNRVLARGYPGNTIAEVLTAPGQFSGYSASIRPNSSCKSAARQVLEKQVWVIPQNVYFFNSDRAPGQNWGSHDFYEEIGNHCFYTESYSGRSRNGKVPPALFERVFKWPQYGCKPEKRVKRIQYMLNKLGYDVKADGYFGLKCKEALMKFQSDHGLTADGVAGPGTIEKLIKTYGVENYLKKYK